MLDAAVRTFVVPRGAVVLFTVDDLPRASSWFFELFASPRRTYEARDRVMALYAPIALLALPFVSILVVFGAFTCIFVGLEHHGWRNAVLTSGSSLLTLGFERPAHLPGAFAAFAEAGIGLALLALLIAYLPTIYNSFSRREVAVTDLSTRAGTPPTPTAMLRRAHLTGFLLELDNFWELWTTWFTEVQETHTSYGSLVFFRSPNPHRSWVTAAGAVLDSAAMRLAVVDIPPTPQAAVCIRSGYLALREVAGFFGFDYDDSPAPDDPISVTRDEFDEVCTALDRGRGPGARRPRPGLARLRGLAGQLRPGADHAGRFRHGSVRAVGVGPLADPAPPALRLGEAPDRDGPARAALTSHARKRSTPAIACIVRTELNTSNAWWAPRSST